MIDELGTKSWSEPEQGAPRAGLSPVCVPHQRQQVPVARRVNIHTQSYATVPRAFKNIHCILQVQYGSMDPKQLFLKPYLTPEQPVRNEWDNRDILHDCDKPDFEK